MLHLSQKNIMGVVVPSVEFSMLKKKLHERGYGIIGTSPEIDEVVNAYEKLVEQVIKAAEIETAIKRLLEEIDKTKRRVNALEFRVIPTLQEDAAYITLRLEEIERENVFRLKPEQKRAFLMNAIRFISLFMLVLGYILIMYFVFVGD